MLQCNSKYIECFYRQLHLENAAIKTIKKHEQSLRMLIDEYGNRDFKAISREKLEEFVLRTGQKEHMIKSLKKFYRLLGLPERTANIKLRMQQRKLLPGDLLDDADVELLIDATTNKRDKAIIALLWDSGIRPEELLTMSLGSLDLEGRPAHITIDGKTGPRTVPISGLTAGFIIDYLDSSRRLGTGFLWAKEERSNLKGPLGWCGLVKMIRIAVRKANLKKKVYP